MISRPAAAAQEQARQADGKFGAQLHSEPQGVVLVTPAAGPRPYNESTNDRSELEDEAISASSEQQDTETAEPDLSAFFEEDRELPRALYRAGLQGTLEPYNGDYPINDGALRYWDEDLNRELVVGTETDGTTVVAMDADLADPIRISVSLGSDPAPEVITAAIRDVSGQVQRANLPDLDED